MNKSETLMCNILEKCKKMFYAFVYDLQQEREETRNKLKKEVIRAISELKCFCIIFRLKASN